MFFICEKVENNVGEWWLDSWLFARNRSGRWDQKPIQTASFEDTTRGLRCTSCSRTKAQWRISNVVFLSKKMPTGCRIAYNSYIQHPGSNSQCWRKNVEVIAALLKLFRFCCAKLMSTICVPIWITRRMTSTAPVWKTVQDQNTIVSCNAVCRNGIPSNGWRIVYNWWLKLKGFL